MKTALCLWATALAVVLAPQMAVGQSTQATATGSTISGGDAGAAPTGGGWSWLKMPKVTMPKLTMPKIEMPKMPADPLAPVKSSAKKVSDGTKKMWEGTKELFTFGGDKNATSEPRLASRPEEPSLWHRMFGGAEEAPEGPQTVADWMAQPRPE